MPELEVERPAPPLEGIAAKKASVAALHPFTPRSSTQAIAPSTPTNIEDWDFQGRPNALALPNIYAAAVALRHLECTAGYPVGTCEGESVLRQSEIGGEKAATRFQAGEELSVNGRVATFLYLSPVGAAVVRYTDETITRVVPAHKLAAPPSRDRL